MRFGVLGSLEVRHGDALVDVGGRQQRLVLASLLATAGRPVSADALVDAIWGEAPPPSALGTLQSYVSRLRKVVDPQGTGAKLVFDDAGYRLEAGADAVDFRRFEALADEGHGLLDRGQPDDAAAVLAEALALWRGPAFSELNTHPFFSGIATRLEERRLTSVESRVGAELRLGRHAALVGELIELVSQHPLREGLRGQLALALYRSGRQADALAVLADARATLREELGVDPGPRLQALEAAILNHDAALEPAAPPATAPAGRAVTARSGQPDATSSLAGRAVELDVLLQALHEAASEARFVVIEGDPGIGKTHLAEELRARAVAAGSLAIWGRSDESGAAPSLWPWLPILRTLDEHSGTSGAGALDDLDTGDTPLLAGRGAAVRFERFEAIADQLERAGATAPVVALLDDLQWADATSLDLLRFLATRLRRGVLVVAIVRTLELGRSDDVTDALGAIAARPGSRRLQLAGLDEDATAALLDTAGFGADMSLVHRIHTRAEGNPFYALELARLLDESALTGTEVPATVRDVIRSRLGQLPESTRELLTVAAITGRDVDVHLLARAAALALDQCLDHLEPAVVHRYLVDSSERPGVLRFCHALVREVLADGLTPLRRARLHLAVADAIEAAGGGAETAEIVADHLWRAAPIGVGRRAAEALERAAEVAVHRVSYAAAEDLLQRSVQLRRATATGDDDVRAELRVLLRWLEVMQATRYFQGADGGALARAQELAERFGDEDLHRKLYWYEWAALSTAASVEEAARLAERFLAQPAAEQDPAVRTTALAMQGISCWQQGRFVDAVANLEAGTDLLSRIGPPTDALDIEQRVILASFRLVNHALHGDWAPDAVFAGFLQLVETVPGVGASSICGIAGSTAACLGRWEQLATFVERAFTADPSSQFAFWGGQLLMQRGILEARAGRVTEGLEFFRQGEQRYAAIGGRTVLASFRSVMALTIAPLGAGIEAAKLVAAAGHRDVEEPWSASLVRIAEAAVEHAAGNRDAAVQVLASARDLAQQQGGGGLARRAEEVAAELGLELPAAITG